jgi:hypothetical protein
MATCGTGYGMKGAVAGAVYRSARGARGASAVRAATGASTTTGGCSTAVAATGSAAVGEEFRAVFGATTKSFVGWLVSSVAGTVTATGAAVGPAISGVLGSAPRVAI